MGTDTQPSSYCFISYVGTQIFGSINPILAVLGAGLTISHAHLLTTKKVQKTAETLAAFCTERNITTEIHPVPDQFLKSTNTGPELASFLAELHTEEGERCIFNIKGGMSSMLSATLLDLFPLSPLLVSVSHDVALISDTADGTHRACRLQSVFTPEAVLRLQGVSVTIHKRDPNTWNLVTFCERGNLPLPKRALTFAEVGGITFDAVWTTESNGLVFLFNATHRAVNVDENNAKAQLTILRDLEHWAQTRERSGDIYDRILYAVTDSANVLEHLKKEGTNKIRAVDATGWMEDPSILRTALEKLFVQRPMRPPQPTLPKKHLLRDVPNNTLITFMGTDPHTTLLTLATHAPQHALIGYTSAVRGQSELAKNLKELEPRLGIDIQTFACDITGIDVEGQLAQPKKPESVIVHVSPGTKELTSFLSLWAWRNKCPVWAFDPQNGTSVRLDAEARALPIIAPDILQDFAVRSIGVTCSQSGQDTLSAQLLRFLLASIKKGRDDQCFKTDVSVDGMSLCKASNTRWTLTDSEGHVQIINLRGGEWFEELTAYAFIRAGATNVHTRMRLERTPESINYFVHVKKFNEENVFLRDMDVVGSFGPSNFLVSCKSNPYEDINAPAAEAADMAPLLGRFTLPLLCHMGVTKARLLTYGSKRVYAIGWRDLCAPKTLKHCLQTLHGLIGNPDKARKSSPEQ
ncbi:MAG: hypothetical protein IJU76_04110 [Desulfovibrionaceae bacterium]|nr:hypothetical protein [Desulfovibrionaceae bacterium]